MPTRITLRHSPPPHVPKGGWFFLTLCCTRRGENQLCRAATSAALLDDARHYHRQHRWGIHLLLLMPDHLHAIACFPQDTVQSETIRHWKRLTARHTGVEWQRNYFDHRLRSHENLDEKAAYIRANPVRAGLCVRAADWPYFIDVRSLEGA